MRLGAPVAPQNDTPEAWIAALREKNYRAAFCPVSLSSSSAQRHEFSHAAQEADIHIAEVGAWINPLSPDGEEASRAFTTCVQSLRLADEIGANCCVNICGNLGKGAWDGASAANYASSAFATIVASVQRIIDEAAPIRASYCLETMPWMLPDSPESYLELVEAINRPRFGVHFDPVNLLNSPRRHFNNGPFIEECVAVLGELMLSVHAKDQAIANELTLHMPEVLPGTGDLDYPAFLRALSTLHDDLPIMIEHLSSPLEYDQAAAYIRKTAKDIGIEL